MLKRKRILAMLLAAALLAPMAPAAHIFALEGAIPVVIPIESNLSVKYWVTATASSNSEDADLAIDGDLGTAWFADGGAASLTIDLSGAYDAVYKTQVVFAGNASAYKYIIEGSADGAAWSTLADRSGNTQVAGGFTDVFKKPGIRYIRLSITGGSPVGVKEFRVLNFLRDDVKGGSDIASAQTGTFYYNRNNDPPQMMPDGSREYRGGTGNEASIPTGNNFYGLAQDLGWDTIRLRIWNEPRSEGGWTTPGVWDNGNGISATFPTGNANGGSSPNATRNHARYIVGAGQKLAIDFHYADSWADPQNQPKPYAWANLPWDDPPEPLRIPDMTVGAATRPETYNPDDDSQHKIITRGLVSEVEYFTYEMIKSLIDQGTAPSIVALGNECTHGFMWGKEYRLTNYYGPDTTYNDHHDYYHRFIRDNEKSILGTGTTYAQRYATSTIVDREDIAYGGGVEWLNYDRANGDVNSPEYKSFLESVKRFATLIDAGQRAIHRLNEEYKDSPLLPEPMLTELHFANNVAAEPRGGSRVSLDPDIAFEKLQTLVTELNNNLSGMSGMVDRIGLSYYPDWHGPTWMFQRNCVEIQRLVPGIKVNMSECGTGANVATTQEYLAAVNDVPNNAGMGVWPWSGSGSNGSFRSTQLAFAISHATGVVESGIYATAKVGTAPELPAAVKELRVSDGAISYVPVEWDAINPADYAKAGTFTVRGTAEAKGNMNAVTANITVLDEDEYPEAVGVFVGEKTHFGNKVEYTFGVADMLTANLVELTFTANGGVLGSEAATLESLNGFSVFDGPNWQDLGNGLLQAKVVIGTYSGVTKTGTMDVLKLGLDAVKLGDATISLTGVRVFGIDDAGDVAKSIERPSECSPASATTKVFSIYDLNGDDEVDLADLSLAFYYYFAREGDENWESAKVADVNGDLIVNMGDLIEIYANFI